MSLLGPWDGELPSRLARALSQNRGVRCSLPATAQCGQPDLCHVDGSLGTQKGGDSSAGLGDSNNDDNSSWLLNASYGAGAVQSAHHLTETPRQAFAVGTVVTFVSQKSEGSQEEV